MKHLAVLLAVACGCGGPRGKTLELMLSATCGQAATITLEVTVEPAAAAPALPVLEGPGAHRVVLLLPSATERVRVTATARTADDDILGSASVNVPFPSPLALVETLTIGGACPGGADLGMDLAPSEPPDFAASPFDFASGDLATTLEAEGMRGVPYEGESSQAPSADNGVALLIKGMNLMGATVGSPDLTVEVGAVKVNAAGTVLATSVRLKVDPLLPGGKVKPVPIDVSGRSLTLPVRGLGELAVPANQTLVLQGSAQFSTVTMGSGSQIQFVGVQLPHLFVTGLLAAGSISSTARRFPGCSGASCNAAENGPGFGAGGTGGGGGAGHALQGTAVNGANGGAAYGHPSLIGLPAGSGGGSGSGGTVPGGAGGGVLRIEAGRIALSGTLSVNGSNGGNAGGLIGGGAGAGGSGGSLLIQAHAGLTGGTAQALPGAGGTPGTLGGSPAGASSKGRIRLDVATTDMITTTFDPPIGYQAAMVAADWPSAWGAAPTAVDVICGGGASFRVLVNGTPVTATCASMGAPARQSVDVTGIIVEGQLNRICVEIDEAGTDSPAFPGDLAENVSCRAIAVAGP